MGKISFLNKPSPASFFVYFQLRKQTTIFTTNKCEKCPSSKWHWDSNTQPLEHESPPLTTGPGLPPKLVRYLAIWAQPSWQYISRPPCPTFQLLRRVTRWLNSFYNIWPFATMKICPIARKVDSKFCQRTNKPWKIAKGLQIFVTLYHRLRSLKSGILIWILDCLRCIN